ncbi:MAG: hypothetical protein SNJ79_05940 [Sphingomonadaceae bacterium]
MSQDLPLFRWQERYPGAPGFRRRETSSLAAGEVRTRAGRLRDEVLALLRREGPMTADEAAVRLGESVLSVRPRFSELALERHILETPERRRNASGRFAIVWKVA